MPLGAGQPGLRRLRRPSRRWTCSSELRAACPNGIDAYFENVGGAVQAAVFDLLNPFARVAMCGMVSQYNEETFPPGPNLGFVVGKRVLIQGFIVSDRPERLTEWRKLAAPWVADGSLIYREDVVDGLENAPEALAGILSGRNFGKLLVRVGARSTLIRGENRSQPSRAETMTSCSAHSPSSPRTEARAEPIVVRPGISASIRAGASTKWMQPPQVTGSDWPSTSGTPARTAHNP